MNEYIKFYVKIIILFASCYKIRKVNFWGICIQCAAEKYDMHSVDGSHKFAFSEAVVSIMLKDNTLGYGYLRAREIIH